MKLFDEWVYRNLRRYGNVSINPKWIKLFGTDNIIKDIEGNGFNNVEIDCYSRDCLRGKYVITPRDMLDNQFCIIKAR
ncbi:hypothetical protein CWE04_11490 [Thomasclavelia cocleata]|uniref:Uncharacterized protein n=1 Tax=Thomasclavelia cocleata TaxID=69824 RepID=A0A1I0GCL3_9FIRM|nr:hypothetical protein [Thomasclavelia cocleata]MCR1959850.1 hypothetical protein [Thomasclavelia cocleata]NDO43200.1 hypothetical protein [Thomasclavelia cocleata]PJN79827.1 hypothetical protein CWE04_11490 [Thomasclavelia cocleata]SET68631.1 hypothetical protein SAMN04489758_12826 [Thomasclavelia cocleata]